MDVLELARAFAGPVATFVAAVAATVITWWFNFRQLEIAKGQMSIADAQRRIAAGRLNLDLYEKRYAVFEAARRLLVMVVQHDHVDAEDILKFKFETAEALFLFDQDMVDYLAGLQQKVLRLRTLKAQEKAADEYGEEEKYGRLVDLAACQHQALADELPSIIEKFKPYLKLGNV